MGSWRTVGGVLAVVGFYTATAQSQGGSSGQGFFGDLDSQPTFKEENYLNALSERSRYTTAADFTFDLPKGEGRQTVGLGGTSLQIELGNKPALMRSGAMAQSLFHLKACGLNVPHMHPRAAKVLHVLEGKVEAGFVEEGRQRRVISQNLTAGQSFVFPRGLMMWIHNLHCEDARYVDTWSTPDPGILNIVPALMKLPIPTIAAAFDIDTASAEALAARSRSPLEQGPPECLARCGIAPHSPAAAPGAASQILTLTAGPRIIDVLPVGGR